MWRTAKVDSKHFVNRVLASIHKLVFLCCDRRKERHAKTLDIAQEEVGKFSI